MSNDLRSNFLRDPKKKSTLQKIAGTLFVPIWIIMLIASTLFLAVLAIVVSIESLTSSKKSKPRFKPRSIFVRD